MTPRFTIDKEAFRKAAIKFLLVVLGGFATFLEINLFQIVQVDSSIALIATAVNTAVVDLIRKFIADEEGKLGGFKIA